MKKQKKLIHEKNWDYLFILDACRHDIFERVYGDYLSGKLSPVKSAGSATQEWAINTFENKKMDDIVYVSGNPWFNSKFPMKDFDAREHFNAIIDVWDWGWNEDGTVRPIALKKGLEIAENNFPKKRKIIHFMQPHQPYLPLFEDNPSFSHKVLEYFFDFLKKIKSFSNKGERTVSTAKNEKGNVSLRREFGDLLRNRFGKFNFFMFRKLLGLPPATIGEAFYRYGRPGLKKYYADNLKIALEEVESIVNSLNGNIVISADHGEFLGRPASENHNQKNTQDILSDVKTFSAPDGSERILGHPYGAENDTLRKVPWLEIKNDESKKSRFF